MVKIPEVKIVGVGGAGCRLVDKLLENKFDKAKYYAVDCDSDGLFQSVCENKILLDIGDNEDYGQTARRINDRLSAALKGADMVILVAGVGGGIGCAATRVIADLARENKSLTAAVVCTPFSSEGVKQLENSQRALSSLKEKVDNTIVIPLDKIKSETQNINAAEALKIADDAVCECVNTMLSATLVSSIINVEFEDFACTMKNGGNTYFGTGCASGADRAVEAAKAAMNNKISDIPFKDKQRVTVCFYGGDLQLEELDKALRYVLEALGNGECYICTSVIDDNVKDRIKVSILATRGEKTQDGKTETPFSYELNKILKAAENWAKRLETSYIASEHIMYAMLDNDCMAGRILQAGNVNRSLFFDYLDRSIDRTIKADGYTPKTKQLLQQAQGFANYMDGEGAQTGSEHLLLAILNNDDCLATHILKAMGADLKKIMAILEKVMKIN